MHIPVLLFSSVYHGHLGPATYYQVDLTGRPDQVHLAGLPDIVDSIWFSRPKRSLPVIILWTMCFTAHKIRLIFLLDMFTIFMVGLVLLAALCVPSKQPIGNGLQVADEDYAVNFEIEQEVGRRRFKTLVVTTRDGDLMAIKEYPR
ncbi:hypothetical protein M8J77_010465 [Diaphorina citri]|nr:hypothetical protein M8J77_010465 [Diaphorina citri]